jgi:hypothetical protein
LPNTPVSQKFLYRKNWEPNKCKVDGGSNMLALVLHALIEKNYYFKEELCYYPQPNLQLTTNSKLRTSNTPDYNELNVLHPRIHV